jgi:hypothetical protein
VNDCWHRGDRETFFRFMRAINVVALHHPQQLHRVIAKFDIGSTSLTSYDTNLHITKAEPSQHRTILINGHARAPYHWPFSLVHSLRPEQLSCLRLETLLATERDSFTGVPNAIARTELLLQAIAYSSTLRLTLDSTGAISIHAQLEDALTELVTRNKQWVLGQVVVMALRQELLNLAQSLRVLPSETYLATLEPLGQHLIQIRACCVLMSFCEPVHEARQLMQQCVSKSLSITLSAQLLRHAHSYDVLACALQWILCACVQLRGHANEQTFAIPFPALLPASIALTHPRCPSALVDAFVSLQQPLARVCVRDFGDGTSKWARMPEDDSSQFECLVALTDSNKLVHIQQCLELQGQCSVTVQSTVKILQSYSLSDAAVQQYAWVGIAVLVLPQLSAFCDVLVSRSEGPIAVELNDPCCSWTENTSLCVSIFIDLYESYLIHLRHKYAKPYNAS